jgi:hypothetical protein
MAPGSPTSEGAQTLVGGKANAVSRFESDMMARPDEFKRSHVQSSTKSLVVGVSGEGSEEHSGADIQRSSSQAVNNAVGVSLNRSTQSFETIYCPLESSVDNLGSPVGVSPQNQAARPRHYESRIVCVSGIEPSTPDAAILQQFECFGDIHSISSKDSKLSEYVVIVYQDIRAARLAMHSSGTQWRGRQLACSMLDDAACRGIYNTPITTLYLVSLDYERGDIMDDIFYLLSAYGELKELKREVHSRSHCCIVEYYDSRHAVMAFNSLKSVEGLSERLLVFDARDVAGYQGTQGGFSSSEPAAGPSSLPNQLPGMSSMPQSLSSPSSISVSYPPQLSQQAIDEVLTKNLSEMSLDSSNGGFFQNKSYSSLQQHSLDQIWNDTPGSTVGSGISQSSSPPASNSSLFLSPSNTLLAALQAQQRVALQTQQIQAQTQQMQAQNNAAIQLALGGAGGMHRNKVSHQYNNAGSSRLGAIGGGQSPANVARRNHSDPGLGGRLARNKMNPVAEAERKAHQNRLYGLNLHNIAAGTDKRTTLMIKNIPNKYTQKMLLSLLEDRFAGVHPFPFDFFYLPIDFKNRCNVGYAFINMTSPLAIPALVEEFHGKRWPKFNSEKVCQIAYGRIQGKLSLIQHFQNSSLLNEDKRCRPVLFNDRGEVEAFPIGPEALAKFSLRHHGGAHLDS